MSIDVILLGADGSPAALRAATWTAGRAAELDAEVVVVHALDPDTQFWRDITPDTMTNWRSQLKRGLVNEWCAPSRDAGVRFRASVIEGPAAPTLVQAAEHEDADLIVLGLHSGGAFADRLLGNVASKVTHRATRPVVVVPPEWRPEDEGSTPPVTGGDQP